MERGKGSAPPMIAFTKFKDAVLPPSSLSFNLSKMKKNPATPSSNHGDFIAAVCGCLSRSELKDWLPEGLIHYRDVCFFILPDQSGSAPRLSMATDLGEISPKKRLDAYRHMASYNL